MKTAKKVTCRAVCTYTTNPETEKRLCGKSLKIVITPEGISAFEERTGVLIIFFKKKDIIECKPHDLVRPGPFDDFRNSEIRKCESCDSYYDSSVGACKMCASLYIKDPMKIYENFEYALKFGNRYYRDAFMKFIPIHAKNKTRRRKENGKIVICCPKVDSPVAIDEDGICSASSTCDGILSSDAVRYFLHESRDLPPELSEPNKVIKRGSKCPHKK